MNPLNESFIFSISALSLWITATAISFFISFNLRIISGLASKMIESVILVLSIKENIICIYLGFATKYLLNSKWSKFKSIITSFFLHKTNNSAKVIIFSSAKFLSNLLPKFNFSNCSKVLLATLPFPFEIFSKLSSSHTTGIKSEVNLRSALTIWYPLLIASEKPCNVLGGRWSCKPTCGIILFNSMNLLNLSFGFCKTSLELLTK